MAEGTDKVWSMMENIAICMLTSWDGSALQSRPMAAYVRRDEGMVYFFTDVNAHKDDDIRKFSKINLAFQSGNDFASVGGTAEVSNDRIKIRELFDTQAKAWWDSADDPNIRLLKFTPADAQYWDSPAKPVALAKMAMAAVSNTRPKMGENKKVSM